MGRRNKKGMKHKICEFTYRRRGLNPKLSCLKKSMDEVYHTLNPKC